MSQMETPLPLRKRGASVRFAPSSHDSLVDVDDDERTPTAGTLSSDSPRASSRRRGASVGQRLAQFKPVEDVSRPASAMERMAAQQLNRAQPPAMGAPALPSPVGDATATAASQRLLLTLLDESTTLFSDARGGRPATLTASALPTAQENGLAAASTEEMAGPPTAEGAARHALMQGVDLPPPLQGQRVNTIVCVAPAVEILDAGRSPPPLTPSDHHGAAQRSDERRPTPTTYDVACGMQWVEWRLAPRSADSGSPPPPSQRMAVVSSHGGGGDKGVSGDSQTTTTTFFVNRSFDFATCAGDARSEIQQTTSLMQSLMSACAPVLQFGSSPCCATICGCLCPTLAASPAHAAAFSLFHAPSPQQSVGRTTSTPASSLGLNMLHAVVEECRRRPGTQAYASFLAIDSTVNLCYDLGATMELASGGGPTSGNDGAFAYRHGGARGASSVGPDGHCPVVVKFRPDLMAAAEGGSLLFPSAFEFEVTSDHRVGDLLNRALECLGRHQSRSTIAAFVDVAVGLTLVRRQRSGNQFHFNASTDPFDRHGPNATGGGGSAGDDPQWKDLAPLPLNRSRGVLQGGGGSLNQHSTPKNRLMFIDVCNAERLVAAIQRKGHSARIAEAQAATQAPVASTQDEALRVLDDVRRQDGALSTLIFGPFSCALTTFVMTAPRRAATHADIGALEAVLRSRSVVTYPRESALFAPPHLPRVPDQASMSPVALETALRSAHVATLRAHLERLLALSNAAAQRGAAAERTEDDLSTQLSHALTEIKRLNTFISTRLPLAADVGDMAAEASKVVLKTRMGLVQQLEDETAARHAMLQQYHRWLLSIPVIEQRGVSAAGSNTAGGSGGGLRFGIDQQKHVELLERTIALQEEEIIRLKRIFARDLTALRDELVLLHSAQNRKTVLSMLQPMLDEFTEDVALLQSTTTSHPDLGLHVRRLIDDLHAKLTTHATVMFGGPAEVSGPATGASGERASGASPSCEQESPVDACRLLLRASIDKVRRQLRIPLALPAAALLDSRGWLQDTQALWAATSHQSASSGGPQLDPDGHLQKFWTMAVCEQFGARAERHRLRRLAEGLELHLGMLDKTVNELLAVVDASGTAAPGAGTHGVHVAAAAAARGSVGLRLLAALDGTAAERLVCQELGAHPPPLLKSPGFLDEGLHVIRQRLDRCRGIVESLRTCAHGVNHRLTEDDNATGGLGTSGDADAGGQVADEEAAWGLQTMNLVLHHMPRAGVAHEGGGLLRADDSSSSLGADAALSNSDSFFRPDGGGSSAALRPLGSFLAGVPFVDTGAGVGDASSFLNIRLESVIGGGPSRSLLSSASKVAIGKQTPSAGGRTGATSTTSVLKRGAFSSPAARLGAAGPGSPTPPSTTGASPRSSFVGSSGVRATRAD